MHMHKFIPIETQIYAYPQAISKNQRNALVSYSGNI